jgi:hypothetical protein
MEWESMMQSKFHIVLLLKVPKHENFELPFTLSDSIWKAYLLTQKCFFFILVLIWWNFAWWMSYFFFNLGQNLKFLVVTFRPICMLIMCFSKNFKVLFCFECLKIKIKYVSDTQLTKILFSEHSAHKK